MNEIKYSEKLALKCEEIGVDAEVVKNLRRVKIEAMNTLLGVYARKGAKQTDNVPFEDLAEIIRYNVVYRFGRALFINGIGIYNGYLRDVDMFTVEENIRKNGTYKPPKNSFPHRDVNEYSIDGAH